MKLPLDMIDMPKAAQKEYKTFLYERGAWRPAPVPTNPQPVFNENYIMKLQGEEIKLLKQEVEDLKNKLKQIAGLCHD